MTEKTATMEALSPVKAALRAYAEASKGERCPICNGVEGCDHTVKERLLVALAPAGVGSELERFTPYLDRGWGVVTKAVMTQTPLGNWVRLEDHLACIAASLSQLQHRPSEWEALIDRAEAAEAERDEVIRTSAAYNATEREAKAIMEEAAAIERAEAAEAELAAALLRIQELEDPRVAAANERGRQAAARRSVDNG